MDSVKSILRPRNVNKICSTVLIHQSCLKNCNKCTKQQGVEVVQLAVVLKTRSSIPVTGSDISLLQGVLTGWLYDTSGLLTNGCRWGVFILERK